MIHDIFPIKLYHKNSGIDHSTIIKEMLDTMGNNSSVTNPVWDSNKGYSSWTKYFWLDNPYYGKAHLNPAFKEITDFINDSVKEYQEELKLDTSIQELRLTTSYLNFQDSNTQTPLHDHEGNSLVGTYYILMEGECPGLAFMNPSTIPFKGKYPWNVAKYKEDWKEEVIYYPTAGDLFLWPSDILHGTDKKNSWHERYFLNMGFHFYSDKTPNFPPL